MGFIVDENGSLEPAVEPGTSFVAEVQKWCQYFFLNFVKFLKLTTD
jgi:hypothetical protein